ncbi:MAG TPA: hypothetical protein VEP49_19965 [Acidimicrobiia bacterium]|nr:hypothetical protein [Acidimicrobiia bacterium]
MTLVYRPDGDIGQEPATLAPSPGSLAGLRIAVLDNGKPNAAFVMTRLAEALAGRAGAQVVAVRKKGPRGESANAAIPCDPEIFDLVVSEADVVITGTADCGSCTAYSVYDGIELEKAGRPAVVVTTTEFRPIAETMAAHFGLPELRLVVLPHPIGGTDPDTLSVWADDAVDTVLGLCTRRAAA